MNRHTARDRDGNAFYVECFEHCNGEPGECGNCKCTDRQCETLAAYEDTGLTPAEIMQMKSRQPILNAVNIGGAVFAEVEEQLNAELQEAVRILKNSPMFEGRVTIAIVIGEKGTDVRPILYKTKYTPRTQKPDAIPTLPGQMAFDE